MSPRSLLPVAIVFFTVFVATALLSGSAALLVPVVVLAAIVAAGGAGFALLSRRAAQRAGSPAADETDPAPGTAFATDDETPLGDTPEAHDEISPHDLPMGHPGRSAAERLAASSPDSTTRGGVRLIAGQTAARHPSA